MIARGSVVCASAGIVEAQIPAARVGTGVRIASGDRRMTAVVSALRGRHALLTPHEDIDGIAAGDSIVVDPAALTLPLGTMLLGRAIDPCGNPLDDRSLPRGRAQTVRAHAPDPAQRAAVAQPFWTGIRAVDTLLTLGRGARIGLFGPPGCGKSTLLHVLMRGAYADAVVVGLVGERGREAEEWMRACPPHASIVCASSDRSAAQRVQAARVAMAQAGALRERGLHVLLILDSLARYAYALREIALACGESTGRAGYPPSVFAQLASLVEIAGATKRGSITLVATVLSDGDDRDPVSESARSLLDGHIALSPKLAQAGRFPAIDMPASVSRTMNDVVDAGHAEQARLLRRAIAALAQSEDARSLGIMPADAFTLRAMAVEPQIETLLRQAGQAAPPHESLSALAQLADTLR